jgi:hypothetical protein
MGIISHSTVIKGILNLILDIVTDLLLVHKLEVDLLLLTYFWSIN